MKYSKEIIIDLPREEVIAKMENPENFKHCKKDLFPTNILAEIQAM
jgi:hypothetical protein